MTKYWLEYLGKLLHKSIYEYDIFINICYMSTFQYSIRYENILC